MKLTALILTLALASSAFADSVTFSKDKKSVELSGLGATKEIFVIIAKAYEKGYKDFQGADFFDKISSSNRVGGRTLYTNKLLAATVQSGITLSYQARMSAKKTEIEISDQYLIIQGESAVLLKGAMALIAERTSGPRPVGSSRYSSPSGKVVCSRVVYPKAPTVCVIKL